MPHVSAPRRVPFATGFIDGDLAELTKIKLCGSRCRECGVVLFGQRHRCENCSSKQLDSEVFSRKGIVYSFTIQRYPPPLPFRPPNPWIPRPIAWVDLDASGPRILGRVDCPSDAIKIGAQVELFFEIAWLEEPGDEVIAYGFRLLRPSEAIST